MIKSVNHLLCDWRLVLIGHFLLLSQSVYAEVSFRIDPVLESTRPRYAVENVGSWDEFRRIRQGSSSVAETAPGSTDAAVPDGSRPEIAAESTKGDVSGAQPVQQTPVSQAPAAQQTPSAATVPPLPQPPPALHQGSGDDNPMVGNPAPEQIFAPVEPTEKGSWWVFYAGVMAIHANPYYDPHGVDFKWAYSRKNPLPKNPRIVVHMHGSGGGQGSMEVFGPSPNGDIEVRAQDAEAYNQDWREWWTFGRDGTPYPGRRIAATLDFLVNRYKIDTSSRGIVLEGPSMGGSGAVIQTMILPDPWRRRIAYSAARAGIIMPRQVAQKDPAQYVTFPPDSQSNRLIWDSIDFSIQAAIDPVVQGIHYRHSFSSDDQFSRGVEGSTQLEFVNLVEKYKIGGAFVWVQADHGTHEPGVNLPDLFNFESKEQDVTLDRAHPAITNSTGNYPLLAVDRVNQAQYPRGHYNMGITWNHADIIDDPGQIVFPLKYNRRTAVGKDVPDQPARIVVSVTPRRPRSFTFTSGETLKWSWDGGALSGVVSVTGDTVTIDGIPLISGDEYKTLRISR